MASVSVTLGLEADSDVKCDVSIDRDAEGKQTWQRFGWSVGGLGLLHTSGGWLYYPTNSTLYLCDDRLETIVASASSLRSDFLTHVVCGSTLRCSGEVYVLYARTYRPAWWRFWLGCA
jgi:hypothetical protein